MFREEKGSARNGAAESSIAAPKVPPIIIMLVLALMKDLDIFATSPTQPPVRKAQQPNGRSASAALAGASEGSAPSASILLPYLPCNIPSGYLLGIWKSNKPVRVQNLVGKLDYVCAIV